MPLFSCEDCGFLRWVPPPSKDPYGINPGQPFGMNDPFPRNNISCPLRRRRRPRLIPSSLCPPPFPTSSPTLPSFLRPLLPLAHLLHLPPPPTCQNPMLPTQLQTPVASSAQHPAPTPRIEILPPLSLLMATRLRLLVQG
ncbi:hypothetical protein C8F04DRAFT_1279066 [Mycena alexandri]|uniref:Uncharacterized protein n=1 Tax=Mycena alexandri TaxID=1745969 RepID=A0AAD6WNC1_9AGAR|nr:hypothetical protein C8F04DRAFT_1279066 [Mycena alexandri]